jgi:hypothetical protein
MIAMLVVSCMVINMGSAFGQNIMASDPFAVEGESFELTAPGATPWQWSLDDGELSGETNQTLSFGALALGDDGKYTATYEDGAKAIVTSSPFYLGVLPAATTIPVSGLIGLGLLAGACAMGGAAVLRRKK